MGAKHRGLGARDQRDRGLVAGLLGRHVARQIHGGVSEDVVEQVAVAEEPRVPRRKQIPVGGRRERHAGGKVEAERAVEMRHENRAPGGGEPHHLAGQQALVPDVGKRVRQHHHREGLVAERQRVVRVATHGFAAGRGEALRQPQFPEVHVGDDHGLRAGAGQHARQMTRAAAQIDRASGARGRRCRARGRAFPPARRSDRTAGRRSRSPPRSGLMISSASR